MQFSGSFNGLTLTDAYARVDRVAVTFPTNAVAFSLLTANLVNVYADTTEYSAGAGTIAVLGAPIELPMTSPATVATMRADLDPGVLVVLQSTPGLTVTSSSFILDPAPP